MFNFLRTLFYILSVSVLLGLSPQAIAQEFDPTVKDLPGFITDRPEIVPDAPALPADDVLNDGFAAPDEAASPPDSMDDIPDEYIIEASNFGEKCRNDPDFTLYFDCRCLAVKYLDARVEMGPDTPVSGIINRLGSECKDATGIAGQIYNTCLNDFGNAPTHVGPEEFCSCTANTFAKYYEAYEGSVPIYLRVSLRSRARLTCMDPVAARRIYGTIAPP